jgi:hypothetical protein
VSETAVATPDFPEQEHDPEALAKLKNAVTVLTLEVKNTETAAQRAYADVWENAALVHARFRAVVYEMLADCHSAGFSRADVNRVLGDNSAF